MSQKKAKKLRKGQTENLVEKTNVRPVKGIRQILKENWKFLLVLCVGVFVLYFNSLNGAFVSDDYATISQDEKIKNFSYQVDQRWLGGVINWFLAVTFGVESPISFHIFSFFCYLIVLLVVFVFISVLFDNKTAKLTTILFSVLPVHVEAVSWISGRPYLFNAMTVLLSLTLLIMYTKTNNKKYLTFFIVSLFFDFIAERTRFAVLPLLVILYWVSFEHSLKNRINIGKVLLMMALIFGMMTVLLWRPLLDRISNVNSGYNGYGGIFYDPFFQYPTSIAKYLQLIFVPTDLTLYHTMYILPSLLNWLIFLVYLIGVIYFFFKDKKIFFALAFIFVAAALSMLPVKISWLVAERYIFLGSLGFSLFIILFFQRFGKKCKIPLLVLFTLVVVFYISRVFLRNIDWQTNHNLWVNTCQVSPNSHNAWNNIGDDYDKLAQLETTDEGRINQYLNSIKGFTQSVTVKQNYADAYHNRANIFYKIGRYDLAKDSYETALSYGPNLYQSYYSLLQIDLIEKNYNLALDHLNKLNTARPNDPQVYYAASVVYANMGQTEKAVSILEQLVKVNPTWVQAVNMLNQLQNLKKK